MPRERSGLPSPAAKPLLTISDVASRLSCSKSFVYGLLNSGRLRHYALGPGQGGKRVSEEQLQEYLRGAEKGGESSPKQKPPARPITPRHLDV